MHELLTPLETAIADRTAVAMGQPVATLMENAGRSVARVVRRRFVPCRTLVLCGPGNNGGDGYVAARRLAEWGWPVAVAAPAPARGDAAAAATAWRGPNVAFEPAEAARAGLVIDAVFGAGLTRDLDPAVVEVLRAAKRVVAVDVPSGLDGATGHPRGFAPKAELTVTFFRLKPGHKLLPGRALCGETVLADIGLPSAVLETVQVQCWLNNPELWTLPRPSFESHKYSRGHLTIVGGASMTGAARLAAAGARRGGAGMVTIAALGCADVYRSGDPGLIVSEASVATLLDDERRRTWVCGPGLGLEGALEILQLLLDRGRAVVVDADALTACARQPQLLRGAAVLTPHGREFARVFGEPGPDRVAAVRAAAADTGAVVLLKGSDTIIAGPDGRVAINDTAPPDLATAGAGDVLAGLIGALLAQGMPPWEAACAGAWLHGQAGTLVGQGLIAEDLPNALPGAFALAKA